MKFLCSNLFIALELWFRCAIGLLLMFLISILAVYTSNGRQRTAEEDLQDFLGKGTSEADRINSPLSRLWLYTKYRVT